MTERIPLEEDDLVISQDNDFSVDDGLLIQGDLEYSIKLKAQIISDAEKAIECETKHNFKTFDVIDKDEHIKLKEKAKKYDVYQNCLKEHGGDLVSGKTLEKYKEAYKRSQRLDEMIEKLDSTRMCKDTKYIDDYGCTAAMIGCTCIPLGLLVSIRDGKK